MEGNNEELDRLLHTKFGIAVLETSARFGSDPRVQQPLLEVMGLISPYQPLTEPIPLGKIGMPGLLLREANYGYLDYLDLAVGHLSGGDENTQRLCERHAAQRLSWQTSPDFRAGVERLMTKLREVGTITDMVLVMVLIGKAYLNGKIERLVYGSDLTFEDIDSVGQTLINIWMTSAHKMFEEAGEIRDELELMSVDEGLKRYLLLSESQIATIVDGRMTRGRGTTVVLVELAPDEPEPPAEGPPGGYIS